MTNLFCPLIFFLLNLAHLHFQYRRVLASFFCEYRSTFPLLIFGPFCFRLELKGKVQIHRFFFLFYLIRRQTKEVLSKLPNLYKCFTPTLAFHNVFDPKSAILLQTTIKIESRLNNASKRSFMAPSWTVNCLCFLCANERGRANTSQVRVSVLNEGLVSSFACLTRIRPGFAVFSFSGTNR